MKIGINASVLTENNLCGIGHSLFHLLDNLIQLDPVNEYHLISRKKNIHFPKTNNCHSYLRPARGLSYLGMTKVIQTLKCDLAFIPGEVVPFGITVPTILTVYDLFPLVCSRDIRKEISFKNKLHFLLVSKMHLKRADLILAISEDTKKDIIEQCGIPAERILVTPLGVDKAQFYPREESAISSLIKKYDIQPPYFINTSSVWWTRKNLLRLIEAFALFSSKVNDCQLVITGNKGSSYEKMQELIHRMSLEKKIRLLEYIDRADMPSLLSGAISLVFPSLHEGFGLPVLEAMSCGCPVITSRVSALMEVSGEAALFVDPLDIDSIVDAMSEIYHNKIKREILSRMGIQRAKTFSWEKTARLTLQAFNSVCN
jgi:glycosyltransferase involved in cell wall biosynthesis